MIIQRTATGLLQRHTFNYCIPFKQIAEIDGELDTTEKNFFKIFFHLIIFLKRFFEFIEEEEVNDLLDELKDYDDLKGKNTWFNRRNVKY